MIRDDHIATAIAEGVLTPEQAERLRAIAQRSGAADDFTAAESANPDDERFRLIGGFNDVFVTIGVALLASGLFALTRVFEVPFGFSVMTVIAAWALSEVFARRMRLALPSIALALMFALGMGLVGGSLGGQISHQPALLGSAAAVTLGAFLHERRFGVPVNWAIGAVGLSFAFVYALGLVAPALVEAGWGLLLGVLGIVIFLVALRIDASDVTRQTRRSDIAFWLHLVAAPMIVHGTIPLLFSAPENMNAAQALGVLCVYGVLGVVALVIDRRALLVSGLLYAGVALGYLLGEKVETGMGSSLTLLALAVIVLGLSAGWRTIRRALIPLLPLGGLKHSIPPAL